MRARETPPPHGPIAHLVGRASASRHKSPERENTLEQVDNKVKTSGGYIKVPKDIIEKIIEDRKDGITPRIISKRYGVSTSFICKEWAKRYPPYREWKKQEGFL